jgi:hypothetical protein
MPLARVLAPIGVPDIDLAAFAGEIVVRAGTTSAGNVRPASKPGARTRVSLRIEGSLRRGLRRLS